MTYFSQTLKQHIGMLYEITVIFAFRKKKILYPPPHVGGIKLNNF